MYIKSTSILRRIPLFSFPGVGEGNLQFYMSSMQGSFPSLAKSKDKYDNKSRIKLKQ